MAYNIFFIKIYQKLQKMRYIGDTSMLPDDLLKKIK